MSENNPNFGNEIIQSATDLTAQVEARRINSRKRQDLLITGIQSLVSTYMAEAIYVNAVDVQVPIEQGVGVGLSETVGEVMGFSYGPYQTGARQRRKGVLMFMGIGGINDTSATQSPWRQNVLKLYGTEIPEVEGQEQFIIGVPLQQGQRITQLEKVQPLPDTLAELDAMSKEVAKAYDYMTYVKRIDNITGGKPITTSSHDKPKAIAMTNENVAMNNNCPYLGRQVEIDADLIRTRNPDNPERMLIIAGTISGVLRKFIVDFYQAEGQWRYGTQAVIWTPETAQEVYTGKMTPQQADEWAVYVVLSHPHQLTVVNQI